MVVADADDDQLRMAKTVYTLHFPFVSIRTNGTLQFRRQYDAAATAAAAAAAEGNADFGTNSFAVTIE